MRNFIRPVAIAASLLIALALGVLSVQIMAAGDGAPILDDSDISVNQAQAVAGGTVKYTVVISNSGDGIANDVLITNTLPVAAIYVPDSLISNTVGATTVDYGIANGVVTWTGSVDSFGSVTLAYDATLSESLQVDETITNTLQITGTGSLIERAASTTGAATLISHFPILFNALPAPVLDPITGSSGTSWTISWDEPAPNVTGYLVQEANGNDFGSAIEVDAGNDLTESFTHTATVNNQYCYRVRGVVGSQLGTWSNVECVAGNYADEFVGSSTDWAIRRQDTDDAENFSYLEGGQFVIKIKGRWDYAIAAPMMEAPELPYRIETRVKFDDGVDNLHAYAIIFGGDWNGNTCPNADYSSCFNHYYRLLVIYYGAPNGYRIQLKRIDFHDPDNNAGRGVDVISFRDIYVGDPAGYNNWRIDLDETGGIKLYLNGSQVADGFDATYLNSSYFGLMAATDEYLGSEPHFDWLHVTKLP